MHESINFIIAFAVGFLTAQLSMTVPYVVKAWAVRKNLEALGGDDSPHESAYMPINFESIEEEEVALDPEDERLREEEEEELNRFFG